MIPAQQRLDADNFSRRRIDLWLIINFELAMIERGPELVNQCHAFTQGYVESLGMKDISVASGSLGFVKREIRLTHHILGLHQFIPINRNADARRYAQDASADRLWRGNRADDPARERPDDGAICRVAQDSELVAANPGDPIALTHCADQSLRHRLEQFVASRMAERLNDVLEVVEIEVKDGERLCRPPSPPRTPSVAIRCSPCGWAAP